ncbi:unnamed protein product [Effrenium voratum]|nr:unnamed protein product [Effrenium voratum]
MNEVKQLLKEQQVQNAITAAKARLSDIMNMLQEMPADFLHVSPNASTHCKHQYYYHVLFDYRVQMDVSNSNLFGFSVGCIQSDGQPVVNPPETCLQFWASGAFIPQFQFVLVYLNIVAQMAAFSDDVNAKKNELDRLQRKAKQYLPLLQRSYQGFLQSIHSTSRLSAPTPTCPAATRLLRLHLALMQQPWEMQCGMMQM